jgi:hypothetical protein
LKVKVLIAAAVLAVGAYLTAPWLTHQTKEVRVIDSVVKNSMNDSKYLVFTDQGVFQNTDTWYYFKFDSSDIQGKIMQGGKFKLSYYGFRVPFFSMYPNLVSAERK